MCESGNHCARRFGRSLNLFLVDGSPTGIITAELGNWSGKALVAPRTALPGLLTREESSRTGVYLLRGPDLESGSRMQVYVGESDNVKNRLSYHDSDDTKQFYTHVCLIVSKDDSLTKAHVRYLEARIIELIKSASRAVLVNGTNPDASGLLPEAGMADMEGFLLEIGVLLPVLGFDVLRGMSGKGDASDPEFEFTVGEADAKAKEVEGEFVVLSGSLALVRQTRSIGDWTINLRQQLVNDGDLVKADNGRHFIFQRDVAFSSVSSAATVVYGGSISGPQNWRTEIDGAMITYNEWRQRRLQDSQVRN